MFTPDNSHFRKYCATLGVAVIAGSLSLAGLFFKVQSDLLVSTQQLKGMTQVARTAIETRQQYLADATLFLPWILIAIVAIGLLLAGFGLVGWNKRQNVADEIEDQAREKGRLELKSLTETERLEKLDREAIETASAERLETLVSEQGPTAQSQPAGEAATKTPSSVSVSMGGLGARSAQVEKLVEDRLRSLLPADWRVRTDMRVIRSGDVLYAVDIAAFDNQEVPRYLVDVKYVRDPKTAVDRFIDAARSIVSWMGDTEARPIVVLAVEGLTDSLKDALMEQVEKVTRGLSRKITVAIFDADGLSEISDAGFVGAMGIGDGR